jgi:hypothetical protein
MPSQRRKLPPKLDKIDLQAGEKKERRDAEGRQNGDDTVVNKGFEKARDNDTEGKASELGGMTSRPKTTAI